MVREDLEDRDSPLRLWSSTGVTVTVKDVFILIQDHPPLDADVLRARFLA